MYNPFIGNWTYRSLHNTPQEVENFNELRYLTVEEDGPNLIKGRIGSRDNIISLITGRIGSGDYILNIHGTVNISENLSTITFRAVGIENTITAGWVYDFSGFIPKDLQDSDQQRPVIVGTVIRKVPQEPNRLDEQTFSFVAVDQTSTAPTYKLPEVVLAHFADPLHRLHHAVWHGIRNHWNDLNDIQIDAIIDLDWQIEGNRFALFTTREKTRPCVTNGSGEDFLFFHRRMVVQYKKLMSDAGITPIEWRELPQPGADDPDDPNIVPPAWNTPDAPNFEKRLTILKSDEFFWSRLRWWDYQYKDPTYLATLTLGELGALLEFGVHNDMHIRWSSPPQDPDTNDLLPFGRPDYDFSERWNNPRYDWLGEFYSAHVNPVFWRLHGWIDDRIDDWFTAHEWKHPGEVKRIEKGGVQWFEAGRWVQVEHPWVWPKSLGGYNGHGHDHEDQDMRSKRIESMQKLMEILFPPPMILKESATLAVPTAITKRNIDTIIF